MKLEYKLSSAIVIADALSRAPVESNASVYSYYKEQPEDKLTRCLQQVQIEQSKD